jgi:hypothetical protein
VRHGLVTALLDINLVYTPPLPCRGADAAAR